MNCKIIKSPQINTVSSQEGQNIKSGFLVIGSEKKIKEICDICNKILEERWEKARPAKEKVLKKYEEQKNDLAENEAVKFANHLWDKELDSSEVELIERSEIAFLVPMPLKNYLKNTDEANILKDLDQAILEKLKPSVNQFMVFENSKIKVENLVMESIECLSKKNMESSDQWVLLGLKPLTHLLWLSYNKKLNYSYELCRFGGGAKNASEDKISVALRELDEETGISLPYGEEFIELTKTVYLLDANKYEISNEDNSKVSLQLLKCGPNDGENQQLLPQINVHSSLPLKKTSPRKVNIYSGLFCNSEIKDDHKSEDESANNE